MWPVPFVDFADRSIYQWSEFRFDPDRTNFGINIHKYNLFGLNQTVKLGLSLGYTDEVDLSYRSPRIGTRQQHRINFGAYWNQSDEIWINTLDDKPQFYSNYGDAVIQRKGVGFAWEWFRNNRNKLIVGAARGSYDILDERALNENSRYLGDWYHSVPNLSRTTMQTMWVTDHRDNRYFALRGHYLSFGVVFSANQGNRKKQFPGQSSIGFSTRVSKFFRLRNRLFGYVSATAQKVFWNGLTPYNFTRALGYGDYARGYEPYVVEATGFVLIKSALRYELLNRNLDLKLNALRSYRVCPAALYVGTFFDQAWTDPVSQFSYYRFTKRNTLPGEYLAGAGIGIEGVFYYDKVFRFEYSLSRHFEPVWGLYFKQSI